MIYDEHIVKLLIVMGLNNLCLEQKLLIVNHLHKHIVVVESGDSRQSFLNN